MSEYDDQGSLRQQRIDAAIAEYLQAKDAGRPWQAERWLEQYPDLRDELREFLEDDRQALRAFESSVDLEVTTEFAGSGTGHPDPQPAARHAPALPARIGGYRLVKLLGSGGMGSVHEAIDAAGRRVAIKLLAAPWAHSDDALRRFKQEGSVASGINHPRCVFVIAADSEEGIPYIVMELMTGRTLRDLVTDGSRLSVAAAVTKMDDVLAGLEEAHHHGLIHRDIKPANCYLEPNGRVKLGDFGLARVALGDSELTTTGTFIGTPLYASPEQIRGDALDARTDIYSACATLYFLLTGQPPFAKSTATMTIAHIVSEDPTSPRQLNPEIPAALERILLKGLSRDREQRYDSVAALRAALRPFAGGKSTMATLGRRAAAYGIDLMLLTFLGLFISVAQFSNPDEPRVLPWTMYLGLVAAPIFWYSFLSEGIWGATLGKRALRLRVVEVDTRQRASWSRILIRSLVYTLISGVLTDLIVYSTIDSSEYLRFSGFQWSGYVACTALALAPLTWTRYRLLLHDVCSRTMVAETDVSQQRSTLANRPADWRPTVLPAEGFPPTIGNYVILGVLAQSQAETVLWAEDGNLHRKVWLHLRPATADPISLARQTCDRTSRLRWLSGGIHDRYRWDAFLAIDGAPIKHWSPPGAEFNWRKTGESLVQLLHEFEQSRRDGTAIELTSLDQLWMDGRGRLTLLDIPLETNREPGTTQDSSTTTLSHALTNDIAVLSDSQCAVLRETTRQLLTGSSLPLTHRPQPIEAILPIRARKLVDTFGSEAAAETSATALREAIQQTVTEPTETTVFSRMATIGISVVTLGLFVGAMTSVCRIGNQIALNDLRRALVYNQALAFLTSDRSLFTQLQQIRPDVFGGYSADSLRRRCAEYRAALVSKFQQRWDSTWNFQKSLARMYREEGDIERWLDAVALEHPPDVAGVALAVRATEIDGFVRDVEMEQLVRIAQAYPSTEMRALARRSVSVIFAILLTPILVIVIWSSLTRGGVPMLMTGLRVVDSHGRPAKWWLYLSRSLLTWLPVAMLLTLLAWLDIHYPQQTRIIAQTGTLLACLPLAYAVLACVFPRRGPHDWMLGTTVVPK